MAQGFFGHSITLTGFFRIGFCGLTVKRFKHHAAIDNLGFGNDSNAVIKYWKDAYGIRMPEDLAALYDRMAEGLGIFHGVELLSAIIGDGQLPVGLEAGLCARALYSGREAKIDVSPEMATRLLIPDPPSASKQEARTNPFPVTYLVKVLSVEPRHNSNSQHT